MTTETTDLTGAFKQFSDKNGDYYADKFLKIQQNKLSKLHFNWAAAIGSFVWAAIRGNWLLFWIAFLIDTLALVHLAHYFKFDWALAKAIIDQKQNLVDRYDAWSISHLWWAIGVFIIGRLIFGWLADRLYFRQYNSWRVGRSNRSGFVASRSIWAVVIVALILPLMTYRSTQFAPSDRDCLKQTRSIQAGEVIGFKDRFDCLIIADFPRLFDMKRPNDISYKRGDDGVRRRVVEPPRNDRPMSLHDFSAKKIEDSLNYLTFRFGAFFDAITDFLRTFLGAIIAIFVETPWPISMGVLLSISYFMAGPRITIFVAASLSYLAIMGFWKIAMETMSLVTAASVISIVGGLPLGIWMGKSERVQSFFTPILDMMQTIPSFVYLLPAVAFFSIGTPPGIVATVIFAMPPMVRLTSLGIKHVPESTKEAALAFGANPRQLMTKVELPLALPSIMAGVNQVVMMSLSMVVVAGLIGAGGLGFLVTRALADAKPGKGILAGVGIALIAMIIDRVVQKVNNQKQ